MRKILFSFITFLVFSVIFVATSYANTPQNVEILPADEVINEDYFSFGNRSEINGEVNGDVYVAAGEVIVTGTINGDLLTAGGSVVISGTISNDVRVAGGNVTFSGAQIGGNVTAGGGNVTLDSTTTIGGSIVAGAGNLQVFAPIEKGAVIGGGSILLANSIGGNVSVGATNISLSNGSEIDGDLTYYSENEANISEGATVSGDIRREAPAQAGEGTQGEVNMGQIGRDAGVALAGIAYAIKIIDIFWLIVVGLIFIYLLPTFSKKTAEFVTKKLGWAFAAGLGFIIFMPIIAFLFMITIVGIPISFVLFFYIFLLLWMGRIFAIYALGLFILNKLNKKGHRATAYILGIVIYIILSIIPIVDFIAGLVVSLAGVGALAVVEFKLLRDLRTKKEI